MTTLGKLERVELRDIWEREDQHFTPWLAQQENLDILGNTIGIDLEFEAQEKEVGSFSADILCKDTATGHWVLIENQLERTDHGHLGQLLTYAAGLQAVTIVWIAARFNEQHRAALDWLNDITEDSYEFFGLEVELWKIGDSLPAPKFNIISKPNDWTRSIGGAARRLGDGEMSATKAQHQRYWQGFIEFLNQNGVTSLGSRKPRPQHWHNYSIGRTNFNLATLVSTPDNRIGVELFLRGDHAKAHFHLLRDQKTAIETDLGEEISWQELPDRKGSRIAIYKGNTDPGNEADWPVQYEWLADRLQRFDKVFRQRVKSLDASDWLDETDEEGSE